MNFDAHMHKLQCHKARETAALQTSSLEESFTIFEINNVLLTIVLFGI